MVPGKGFEPLTFGLQNRDLGVGLGVGLGVRGHLGKRGSVALCS
jgi:hypothetical protein